MTNESGKNPLSITERLSIAGETLGVSPREIMHEMYRFYELQDSKSLEQMFESYYQWELRGAKLAPIERSTDQIRDLAMRNFDLIAKLADNQLVIGRDDYSAMKATIELEASGPVTQFYRETVSHDPTK